MTGRRFGRLVVIEKSEKVGPKTYWTCRCDCGSTVMVVSGNLYSGNTKSCGCLKKESISARFTKHGHSKIDGYRSWESMIARCYNHNHKSYKNYGGRGITVCKEWLESFEAFIRDMGMRPSPRHSIDRIDNDGNYEPGNCRWATPHQQVANSRKSNEICGVCKRSPSERTSRKLWFAHLMVDGRRVFYKEFNTKEEAIFARKKAEKKYGICL